MTNGAQNTKKHRNLDFISATDVIKRVTEIEKKYKEGGVSVPEAEGMEAKLHRDVLQAIATKNCTNVQAMAALTVKIFRA